MNTLINPKAFVILSACGSGNPETDCVNTQVVESELEKLGACFKLVNGCYEGEREVSFYIELDSKFSIEAALDIARHYTQRSILYVDADRQATLVYVFECGKTQKIGEFKQVSKHDAISSACYTHDIVNGGYYICK